VTLWRFIFLSSRLQLLFRPGGIGETSMFRSLQISSYVVLRVICNPSELPSWLQRQTSLILEAVELNLFRFGGLVCRIHNSNSLAEMRVLNKSSR
jgi:hypothetical protein